MTTFVGAFTAAFFAARFAAIARLFAVRCSIAAGDMVFFLPFPSLPSSAAALFFGLLADIFVVDTVIELGSWHNYLFGQLHPTAIVHWCLSHPNVRRTVTTVFFSVDAKAL